MPCDATAPASATRRRHGPGPAGWWRRSSGTPANLYPRVGFIVTNMTHPPERVTLFYNQRGTAEQHIKEGKNALVWTRPVLPPLRRERGAAATACPGLQPRQLPAHPDLARGSQPLVDDHLAGPTGQDRRQDRQARAIDHASDGRGHGLARVVPAYPRRHCGAASAAAGAMLSAAVTACADCRQGNCVHLSLDPAESPAGRQSLIGGAGRGRCPGTFAVAKAVGRRADCLLDGRVGRPSGGCRFNNLIAAYDADPGIMSADHSCDSDAIRDDIRARGGQPILTA